MSAGATGLFRKELESAEDDLGDAKRSLSDGRFKWATIQAYYAIFHAARALLYPKGYRERSRIVAYLDGLQSKVDALKRLQTETASELNAMLPSVLDRAFKGELV